MRKNEVQIGAVYSVKVSGRIAHVKVLRESSYGGWVGKNLKTHREIRIKTAARLRCLVKAPVERKVTSLASPTNETVRERFNDEVRFNWGYHDAASDVENNRRPLVDCAIFVGTLEEWAETRGKDDPYVRGYLHGDEAARAGTYNRDSKSAWAEDQAARKEQIPA